MTFAKKVDFLTATLIPNPQNWSYRLPIIDKEHPNVVSALWGTSASASDFGFGRVLNISNISSHFHKRSLYDVSRGLT